MSWSVAVLLVLVGVGGLAAAVDAQRSLDDLPAHGIPVTGTLWSKGVAGGDRAGVIAVFETIDGESVLAHSSRFDHGVLDLRPGDPVDLLYSPEDPSVFQGATWAPPRGLRWLGAGWLALTVGVAAAVVARARVQPRAYESEADPAA